MNTGWLNELLDYELEEVAEKVGDPLAAGIARALRDRREDRLESTIERIRAVVVGHLSAECQYAQPPLTEDMFRLLQHEVRVAELRDDGLANRASRALEVVR